MSETVLGALNARYPEYQCHKRVRAARIVKVENTRADLWYLHLEAPWPVVAVTAQWVEAKHAEAGGYLVVYDDGYTSYSPAKAFEEGYTRIL
jgi:hypothetical protein